MLSRLDFGSCYLYSPQGTGAASRASRTFRDQLKKGDLQAIDSYAARIAGLSSVGAFGDLFGGDVTLIPIPGSAPLLHGAPWVPQRICEALLRRGLARDIAPVLRRARAVKKSAYQVESERPDILQHYQSFRTDQPAPEMERILLVDDVVTRGTTLLAGGWKISEAYRKPVKGFAVARSMQDEVTDLVDPCIGEIRPSIYDGWADRRP